jgi:hypothetical protein
LGSSGVVEVDMVEFPFAWVDLDLGCGMGGEEEGSEEEDEAEEGGRERRVMGIGKRIEEMRG